MSEKGTSQAQQYAEGWRRLLDDNLSRFAAAQEQGAKLEAQAMDHLHAAVEQSATLAKQTLSYVAQLSAEWRKHTFEAARRLTDLVSARA